MDYWTQLPAAHATGDGTPVAPEWNLMLANVEELRSKLSDASARIDNLVAVLPSEAVRRAALVRGVDQPSAANTGVYPGTTFTVVTDHVPVSGTTYTALEVQNTLNLNGKQDCHYVNCRFVGPPTTPTGSAGLVRGWTVHGGGHTFTDCTFVPQAPHFQLDGVKGHDMTLTRCDISGVIDGVSIFNTNAPTAPCGVVVDQCWIHDLAYFPNPPDTNHTDGSHADGIQWQGGTGLVVRGNRIEGSVASRYRPGQYGSEHANACILIKPDAGALGNGFIDSNWFYGGYISAQVSDDAPDRYVTDLGYFTNNRFDRAQKLQGGGGDGTWTLQYPGGANGIVSGNVYVDNGHPIQVRRN